MQKENRIFDDLAKVVNGVAGTMAGMGREAQDSMRERTKEFVSGMDFVSREEFDAVKDMAAKARSEVEALTKRLEKLERKPAAKPRKTAKKAVAKPAPKVSKSAKPAAKKVAPKTKIAAKKPAAKQ